MLGVRSPQGQLFSAATELGADVVEAMGFYGRLAREGTQHFRDDDFDDLYCLTNGRPSCPPSLLAMARLLQHYTGISDAEVVERCRYDVRWKVALDLVLSSVEAPFAKSTFQAFRARLTLHAHEGAIFERSVKAARAAGLLPARLHVALDSSPVRGRGAVKDTFNLLSDAIAAVVRTVATDRGLSVDAAAAEAGLTRHVGAGSVKGSVTIDWTDQTAVRGFLAELLADCTRAVAWARDVPAARADVALLRKVIAQDIDTPSPIGPPQVRRGVAPDRTVSIHDPDMRHGHKSTGASYSGHKAHLAVEVTSGVITAVTVSAPAEADGAQVGALLDQTRQITARAVDQAVGDTAYSTRRSVAAAAAAHVHLVTKMPASPKGRYGPGDFAVSPDGQHASCPAGQASTSVKRRGHGQLHEWAATLCGACALRARCTTAASRSLTVGPDFHDRRERERVAVSADGRALLRQRLAAEHAIGRLKNRGAGKARYCGRTKTGAQWLWAAAVANFSLAWGRTTAIGVA